tara:strand:- start:65 stop:1303 length:1239 start_codon:yes stop_codon:yes gene_type:complete
MTFDEIKNILSDKFGADRLSDIAKEFNVTPQVVSNWKSRNQVPYKYVKIIRKKIDKLERNNIFEATSNIGNKVVLEYPLKQINNEEDDPVVIDIIISFFNVLKANIILFIATVFIGLLFTAIKVYYLTEDEYVATAKILPMGEDAFNGELGGLASQLGIRLPTENSKFASAVLYPDIIKSRTLSNSLLNQKFDTHRYGPNQPLIKILGYGNETPSKKRLPIVAQKASRRLSRSINVQTSKRTSLMLLSVTAFEAQLAADIASAVIVELNNMQTKFKLSQVKEKKEFIEDRISLVSMQLMEAEDDLRIFREQNRNILSSPALLLQEDRFQRSVQLQMQVFTTLKTQLELAQIEEVDKSNKVSILDKPIKPLNKSYPQPVRSLFVALIFSSVLGIGLCILMHLYLLHYKNRPTK